MAFLCHTARKKQSQDLKPGMSPSNVCIMSVHFFQGPLNGEQSTRAVPGSLCKLIVPSVSSFALCSHFQSLCFLKLTAFSVFLHLLDFLHRTKRGTETEFRLSLSILPYLFIGSLNQWLFLACLVVFFKITIFKGCVAKTRGKKKVCVGFQKYSTMKKDERWQHRESLGFWAPALCTSAPDPVSP